MMGDDSGWDVEGVESELEEGKPGRARVAGNRQSPSPVDNSVPAVPVPVPVPVPVSVPVPVGEDVVSAVGTPVVANPVVEVSGEDDWDEGESGEGEVGSGDTGVVESDDEGEGEEDVVVPARKPKAKRKSRSKGRQMPGGIRLTDRDYALLTFLGRYRLATIGQLARRFDTSTSALRNRLPRLEAAGFLTWAYTGQTKPKVWTVTETGLRVAGVSLGTPQIKWGTLRHTLGLVDLGITFEEAGELVVTEREIRAASTRYMPTARMRAAIEMRAALAVERGEVVTGDDSPRLAKEGYVLPVTGRQFGHIPDMVLVRQPFPNGLAGSLAIELELNRKTLSEWNLVLSTYRDSTAFASVVYYVVDSDIERALITAIRALGADQKIHVVRFTPIDTTAEPGTSELL